MEACTREDRTWEGVVCIWDLVCTRVGAVAQRTLAPCASAAGRCGLVAKQAALSTAEVLEAGHL